DHLGMNECELTPQKWLAGLHLVVLGGAIFWWAALDDICDVDLVTFHTNRNDDLVEQLSRAAAEWTPAGVFVCSRTFAHKHQPCLSITFAEYDLRAMLVK